MAFRQTRFFGASITDVSTSLGINQQQSNLTVTVVEDTKVLPGSTPDEEAKWEYVNGSLNAEVFLDADRFTLQDDVSGGVGIPAYFRINDNFGFGGLVQRWSEKKSVSGGTTFEINLVDPREVLAGIQVILGGYSGDVSSVPNLLNAFGFQEFFNGNECASSPAGGFGGAKVNEFGMPWDKVRNSVDLLTAYGFVGGFPGTSDFGGPLLLRNRSYTVDLSEIPTVNNDDIRIEGDQKSLLEIIDEICLVLGYDYYFDLVPVLQESGSVLTHVIKVKIIDRRFQPILGKIDQFVAATDGIASENSGVEFRNEPTTGFMVGGPKIPLDGIGSIIFEGEPIRNTIWPFWGLDEKDGTLIIGEDGFTGDPNEIVNINDHFFEANLSKTLEGQFNPDSKTKVRIGELRAALGGMESWLMYMDEFLPFPQFNFGVSGKVDPKKLFPLLAGDRIEVDGIRNFVASTFDLAETRRIRLQNTAKKHNVDILAGEAAISAKNARLIDNYYAKIKSYAENYYGKQYMIKLSNLCSYYDDTIQQNILSVEPQQTGWNTDHPTNPFSMSDGALQSLTDDDGRIKAYLKFSGTDIDLSLINFDEVYLDYTEPEDPNGRGVSTLYVPCEVDPELVYAVPENLGTANDPDARVIVRLSSPVRKIDQKVPREFSAYFDAMTKLMKRINVDAADIEDQIKQLLKDLNASGNMVDTYLALNGAPEYLLPDFVAVGLKSNVDNYGPWIALGPTGKVKYEQNTELNPWNYGSEDRMNAAAEALVAGGLSYMQLSESGAIDVTGGPQLNLGDVLVTAGPRVTNIEVKYGTGGVTTTYRMKTYTDKFGRMSKINADNLRQSNQNILRVRRELREEARRNGADRGREKFAKTSGLLETMFVGGQEKGQQGLISKSTIPLLATNVQQYSLDDDDVSGDPYRPAVANDALNYQRQWAYMMPVSDLPAALINEDEDAEIDQNKAINSLDVLFSPIYTKIAPDAGVSGISLLVDTGSVGSYSTIFPPYEDGTFVASKFAVNAESLNPVLAAPPNTWTSTSTEGLSRGGLKDGTTDVYDDGIGHHMQVVSATKDNLQTRFGGYAAGPIFALRGPIWMSGWGYDMQGKPVPNEEEDSFYKAKTDRFEYGFLQKTKKWKTGPVDLRWDSSRGVWAAPPGHKPMVVTLDTEPVAQYLNNAGGTAIASIHTPNTAFTQYDADGDAIPDKITIVAPLRGLADDITLNPGTMFSVIYDETNDDYQLVSPPMERIDVRLASGATASVWVIKKD